MTSSLFGGPLGYDDAPAQRPRHSSPEPSDQASSVSLPPDLPSRVSDAASLAQTPSPASVASSDDSLSIRNPPSSQWTAHGAKYRRLIRGERQLLAALEQQENDDLSVALYNTHAIKRAGRSARTAEQDNNALSLHRQPKRRWLGQDRWVPAPRWSSWPLEPHRVPAEGEAWNARVSSRDAPIRQLRPHRNRLTDELEECLLDAVSRRARDELACHRNAVRSPPPAHSAPTPAEAPDHSSAYNEGSDGEFSDEDVSTSTDVRDEGTPELLTPPSVNAARAKMLPYPADDLAPASLADDDELLRIARPSARNVLGKLDCLLVALHRARQNHAQRDRSPNKSQSRGRNSVHGHDDNDTDFDTAGPATDKTGADADCRESQTHLPRVQVVLPPRDWSEVLGTAALTGWDQKVVDAAAKRCSFLFDESMQFRTLDEQPVQPQPSRPASVTSGAESDPKPSGWFCQEPKCTHTQAFVSRKDLQRHLRSVHRQNRNSTATKLKEQYGKDGSYVCPEENCPRSKPSRTFQRRDRWLAHILARHGYEYTGPDLVIAKESVPPSRQDDFSCPDPECQRHDWAFPSRWRLNEHLKRVHGVKVPSRPGSRSGASSDACASASETDVSDFDFELHGGGLHGGVHVDGYLTPIKLPED